MRKILYLIRRADAWLTAPNRFPRVFRVQEDLTWEAALAKRALLYLLLLLGLGILVLFFYFAWIYYGPSPGLSEAKRRLEIPTPIPTVVERERTSLWDNQQWLSQDEARDLRQKPNVVNLALLQDRGAALYSKTSTVQFLEQAPWRRSKPFGITSLQVIGTSVELTFNGSTYYLNAYQPFVSADQPKVYVVDAKGQLWETNVEQLKLVDLNEVTLPVQVGPNPNLSFTLSRTRR